MSDETGFTEAQSQAVDRIQDIMREHFTAGVLIVECSEVEDKKDGRQFVWHGGISTALGLTRMLDAKLRKRAIEIEDEED